MHVAVDKGAKEDKAFSYYLTVLEEQGYITPPMQKWVGLIRKHGGKATHLIEAPDQGRAGGSFIKKASFTKGRSQVSENLGREVHLEGSP